MRVLRARTQPSSTSLTVYEAGRRRMPSPLAYARRLWERRRFIVTLARSNLKAQHFNTVFGQLWTVLNPLLLAGVYFLIFGLILGSRRGDPQYLAQLLGGLFFFYYVRNAASFGAKSVIGGGSIVVNTTLPRGLLPVASVLSAALMLGPMLLVYAVFHVIGGHPVGPQLLALLPLLALQTVFNLGLALALAAITVYFRDTSSFLPYVLRIWLYLSPVLYRAEDVPARLRPLLHLNPLTPSLVTWQQVVLDGRWPEPYLLAEAAAWALASLTVGALIFLSRERELALRI